METNKMMTLIDSEGKEIEMYILFTYHDEESDNNYVFYINPKEDQGETFVSRYDDEGNIYEITEEKEWDMLEKVFNDFLEHEEDGEHVHGCGCNHDEECHCDDCDGECDCEDDCDCDDHDCHCHHKDS